MTTGTTYVVQFHTDRHGWTDSTEHRDEAEARKDLAECIEEEPDGRYRLVRRVTTESVL